MTDRSAYGCLLPRNPPSSPGQFRLREPVVPSEVQEQEEREGLGDEEVVAVVTQRDEVVEVVE